MSFLEFIVGAAVVYGMYIFLKNHKLADPAVPNQPSTEPPPKQKAKTVAAFHWPCPEDSAGADVVGESNYQRALEKLAGEHGPRGASTKCTAWLVPEDDNPYDNKAVRVDIEGHTVGYLDRDEARTFRRRLGAKKLTGQPTTCDAVIRGGYERNGKKMSYGVSLEIKELF